MRYFSTPDSPCEAVCQTCTETSTRDDWEGWSELDPDIQECAAPTHCAHCGAPLAP